MKQHPAVDALLRVKAEYLEMPGLHLTVEQAQRLWAVDRRTVEGALTALVNVKFLYRTAAGTYARLDLSTVRRTA